MKSKWYAFAPAIAAVIIISILIYPMMLLFDPDLRTVEASSPSDDVGGGTGTPDGGSSDSAGGDDTGDDSTDGDRDGVIPDMPTYDTVADVLGESMYDNVFVAALGDKYERLAAIEEPKLAVIGGSSVAFGLDSELLARYMKREVVNFGLYASIGSKVMLDLSVKEMNRGDIVVFAPEPDSQTMSLFFGADAIWQAIDVNNSLLLAIDEDDFDSLESAFPAFISDKRALTEKPNPPGIYNRGNFNSYGDINFPRPSNTMLMGYDPNTTFSFDTTVPSEEFIDYFNEYCALMQAKGVTVLFSFCPVNDMALEADVDSAKLAAFRDYLSEKLDCPVISDIEDYIIDYRYFFDTNMHLNDSGVTVRTNALIRDLYVALGMDTDSLDLTDPPIPGDESGDDDLIHGDDSFADYFTYEDVYLPNGDFLGLRIIGVTDAAKTNTEGEITVPYTYDGKQVIELRGDILALIPGVHTLHIGENIVSIADGVFRGCDSLVKVYIDFHPDNCSVSIPDIETNPDGFLVGASEELRIYAREEYLAEFQNHYTWGHYYSSFAEE
ncbi:MAG: hypothetical protein IJX38_00115 [Clostridia bacterium]|nr:hypothetical protein [Clostridia bacterium]